MEAKTQGRSPIESSNLSVEMQYLEACLDGLDQGGEKGLQAALDRIYLDTNLQSVQ